MRNLFLFIFVIFASLAVGQNHTYHAKTLKALSVHHFNENKGKPLGKNATIVYDSFFKKYDITYIDINGEEIKLTLTFVDNGKPNNSKSDNFYYNVTDAIKTKKQFSIELTSSNISSYIFEGVTKIK